MAKDAPAGEVRFEKDFSSATFDDGTQVKFTKLEKRVLAYFNRFPGRVLSREKILDAVSEPGSDKNERSIDFLINRLRGKLGDDVQSPRFIGTQYGEGYVWLRPRDGTPVDLSETFVAIGPFKGLEVFDGEDGIAKDFATFLQADLRKSLRPDQAIAVVPDLTRAQRAAGPQLSIQLGFFREDSGVECVVTTRHGNNDRILDVDRFPLHTGPNQLSDLSVKSRALVQRVLANYWQDAAANAAAEMPLAVALSEVNQSKTKGWSWDENDRWLRSLKAERPNDPAVKMMWATHIHSKYVRNGIKLFKDGTADCSADEAEIERLVLDSLDFAQDHPEYGVMAAKLLYFVDRGYQDLALELATKAHREDAALTSTLAVLGQLLGFTGDTEAAEHRLHQAVQLSEAGTDEEIYALYMLCQLHAATGERDKLSAALKRIFRIKPASIIYLEPFFTDPVTPSLRARAMSMMLKREQAAAMLRHATYISARLFVSPEHRENSLRPLANLCVRRFGIEILPRDVSVHLPGFTGGRRA